VAFSKARRNDSSLASTRATSRAFSIAIPAWVAYISSSAHCTSSGRLFFFKQKTAYEIGLGIPAEPLFRSSPLRRGLAIDSTVDIFTFYVPHRHVYGEQWIKFMKDGVNATPLPTVNTTGYIDHAAFLGTINPD